MANGRWLSVLDCLSLSQKALILVAIPLTFELLFLFTLCGLVSRADEQARRADRAREIVTHTNNLSHSLYGAGAAIFAYSTTRKTVFREKYQRIAADCAAELQDLKAVVSDDEKELALVSRQEVCVTEARKMLDQTEESIAESGQVLPILRIHNMRKKAEKLTKYFLTDVQELAQVEQERLIEQQAEEVKSRELIRKVLTAGVFCSIALALFTALTVVAHMKRRIGSLADNARRIAERQPLSPVLNGTDEIAKLDNVLHEVSGILEVHAREKREFLSMVSHDVRTPINSARAFLCLAAKGRYGQLDAQGKRLISGVESSLNRVINLVDDLLCFEKVQSGKLSIEFSEVSLNSVIAQAAEAVSCYADQQDVELSFDVEPDCFVNADVQRLEQVIVNLLSNAIKYSPASSTVSVRSSIEQGCVTVTVEDQGPGVAPESRALLFQRFYQGQGANDPARGGFGLGLAIAEGIIELHGGKIGIADCSSGSRFWFSLPCARILALDARKPMERAS